MGNLKILKIIKRTLLSTGGLSAVATPFAFSIDDFTGMLVAGTAFTTALFGGIVKVLEAKAKIDGKVPLDWKPEEGNN